MRKKTEMPETPKPPKAPATPREVPAEMPKTKRNPIGNLGDYAHPSKKKGRK